MVSLIIRKSAERLVCTVWQVGPDNDKAVVEGQVAFIYSNRQMKDLNTRLPINSGWSLTQATGINDFGLNRFAVFGSATFQE